MAEKIWDRAVVLGASSGIGKALADRLVTVGTKVVAVGRRKPLLDSLVECHGSDKVSSHVFDVTRLEDIRPFAASLVETFPDIDCVVINAGIQRSFDFTKPEFVDLDDLGVEVMTNYTSAVYLTAAFLPHLLTRNKGHLIYVSATLGLIPSMVRTPNYNASKAALHAFIMATRQQLQDADQTNVRMIEVFPPAVQTELHDERHQPDLINGGKIGMPLDQYTGLMYEGLLRGDEQFAIGPGEGLLKEGGFEDQRQKLFQTQQLSLKNALQPYMK
ncbi:oxidoreductase [Paramyrothecium foliicola]|nr:oxidoreductase [Paramyrothecium foliicola]